jgi:hypothetical protein
MPALATAATTGAAAPSTATGLGGIGGACGSSAPAAVAGRQTAAISQTRGRQRRDGGRPSGNSSRIRVVRASSGANTKSPTQTTGLAQRTGPGSPPAAKVTYASVKPTTAQPSAYPHHSHP